MSHMTEMVLIVSTIERDAVDRLNRWCAENDSRGQTFADLDTGSAGGHKVFCSRVLAMCGNYFAWENLAEALPGFGWSLPGILTLWVDSEGFDNPQVYQLRDGACVEISGRPAVIGW